MGYLDDLTEYICLWMTGCSLKLVPSEIVVRSGDPVSAAAHQPYLF